MKKKSLLILLIILLSAFTLFAEDSPFGSHYEDGSLNARLAIGGGFNGFALYPGVEYIITEVDFGDGAFPVDFGVLAEGYVGYSNTFLLGAAAYGTAHFGLGGLDVEFVKNLDIFFGIGFGFLGVPTFAGVSGITYFIDESMAVFVEYNYLANSSGCLGIQFSL